jgi:hypothetical protein
MTGFTREYGENGTLVAEGIGMTTLRNEAAQLSSPASR